MKNRKKLQSIICGILVVTLLLGLVTSALLILLT